MPALMIRPDPDISGVFGLALIWSDLLDIWRDMKRIFFVFVLFFSALAHAAPEITLGARLSRSTPSDVFRLKLAVVAEQKKISLLKPVDPYSIPLWKLVPERLAKKYPQLSKEIEAKLLSAGPCEDWYSVYPSDLGIVESPADLELLIGVYDPTDGLPRTLDNRYSLISKQEQIFLDLHEAIHGVAVDRKLSHKTSAAIENLAIEIVREKPNTATLKKAVRLFFNPEN